MTRSLALAAAAFLLSAVPAAAQLPDSVPGLRLRLRADTLRLTVPDAFTGAGRLAHRRPPAEIAAAWADSTLGRIAAARARRLQAFVLGDSAAFRVAAPGQAAYVPPPSQAPRATARGLSQYADLGIQLNALLEMRFDQLKNLRCTSFDAAFASSGCRGGFNPPRIDPQFNVRTGGVVGRRVHVNVDYDTQREFDASNNIQVYYQGLEDEILRRVDIGNVTYTAPRSRFITGGIPANNFGISAEAQLGALSMSGLFAQQKGNVVKARLFNIGAQSVQPVDRVIADRDFEPGRFYFVRNPRAFPGYPSLDVLNFNVAILPDSVRVTEVRIYRNRNTIGRSVTETNLTGIQAIARRTDSNQRVGPLPWETLVEGRDYYLDPSGLWFVLASRLDQQDHLAVSYVTARGDTVGTFPATAQPGRTDTLELISEPQSLPDEPTFYYEMRNAYRVGSISDLDRSSVGVKLLVAGSERPQSGGSTFLELLGLALSTDATTFDQYNRLFPRGRDPQQGAPLREYFVVLPHLTPFADSSRLTAQFRTDSLYRTPIQDLRTRGPAPLWSVNLHYDSRGGDDRGSLMLGGFQIRQGSERVTAGGRTLTRNVEYTINYEVGQITFLNPDSLFPQPTQVAVQFEENQAFAVAPTSIYGVQARYDLGPHGEISALGLFQSQKTLFTRPPLGFEPASNAVMGIAGNFRFEPDRLTRWLDALPFVSTRVPSFLTLDAEIATSRPSPNNVGVAYVETFESEGGLFLPLSENTWETGSRPVSPSGTLGAGIDGALGFLDADASVLTWQNLIPLAQQDAAFQLTPQMIDPSIRTEGASQSTETVLWMALHPDTIAGPLNNWYQPRTPGPRWRSITEPLSATGADLSRVEYLELWLLDSQGRASTAGVNLVFDFGTVLEDAVGFQPLSYSVSGVDTTWSGRRRSGEGRLDSERDSLSGAFNAAIHDVGILGDVADSILNSDSGTVNRNMPLCQQPPQSSGVLVYEWGALATRCTRRNGTVDSEDLNNDQHLDTLVTARSEDVFRYVMRVGDPRYFVRDGGNIPGLGQWKLYRIPFRSDTLQIGVPDIRQVRALRMTVIAPGTTQPDSSLFFAMARMRLVGAPWVKRSATPIIGLAGITGQPHGEVIASVISTENRDDLGYVSPPGVTDEGQSVSGVTPGSIQINERSLRLIGNDVRAGERAEAYYRFPEGERNFLGYREMRVWARGRGADWDANRLTFYVKVAQDENNFYLYRQPLRTTTWEPEAVVDFREWFALRALVEQRFLSGEPASGGAACGGDTLAYVACSGPYLVHVRNPAVAPPNLTRVQELAVGFVRDSGNALDSAELWVDDIRLSQVVNDHGYAGALSVNLSAADIANMSLILSRRDGNFRQLGENPSYVSTDELAFASTVRLERLGLERLGLIAPLTFRLDRSARDPFFVSGTDVLASGLPGLRSPRATTSTWGVSVRRGRRGTEWWQRALTDNLAFSALYSSAGARTELSDATSKLSNLRLDYGLQPGMARVNTLPGFLRRALDALPGFLRNSDMVRGLRDSRFRLTPAGFTLNNELASQRSIRESFRVPIETPFDSALPVSSTTAALRTVSALDLRPWESMNLTVSAAWDRDLKDYGDSTALGAIASGDAQNFLGMNVGFVRAKRVAARWAWNPPVASWFRPRLAWISEFTLNRDPNGEAPERTEGDSAGGFRLPTSFGNTTSLDFTASVDVSRMLRGLLDDSSALLLALDRVSQLDMARRVDRRSMFDRPGFDPGGSYIFGLTGLGGYRAQEGKLANAAQDAVADRFNVVVRLPLNIAVTGLFGERRTTNWFLRGQVQQVTTGVETDWPNLQTRWLWNPRTALVRRFITTFNVTAGFQERRSVQEQPSLLPGGAGLRFVQETRSLPLSFGITWPIGVSTTLGLTDEKSRADNAGNTTRTERSSMSADASFSFRSPQELVPLKSPVRTSLRYSRTLNTLCAESALITGCRSIADSRRSEYNLTMDTDMPPSVTAGMSVGYVLSDDRHLNRKFSQFTLTASVRVFFSAGEVR